MENVKKKYTIRITNRPILKQGIWYADKNGREYEAELKVRPGMSTVVFEVTQSQFVYPIDCEVIGERIVELYKPHDK